MQFISIVVVLVVLASTLSLKVPGSMRRSMRMQLFEGEPQSDRQVQLSSAKSLGSKLMSAAALAAATTTTVGVQPAYAARLDDVNTKLAGYGLPPILFVPPGFTPLVSEYGRGSVKKQMDNPIVVQFAHPGNWIEARTTVNNNGEAGTISAGEYQKGDSSFLYVQQLEGGDKLSLNNAKLVEKVIFGSITQKADVTESFKVTNIRAGAKGVNGQEYVLADVFYKLNTEAGFLITRKGVCALTSVGPFTQCLTTVTTDLRWKKIETAVRDTAASFRVYKLDSGIFTK